MKIAIVDDGDKENFDIFYKDGSFTWKELVKLLSNIIKKIKEGDVGDATDSYEDSERFRKEIYDAL